MKQQCFSTFDFQLQSSEVEYTSMGRILLYCAVYLEADRTISHGPLLRAVRVWKGGAYLVICTFPLLYLRLGKMTAVSLRARITLGHLL